MMMNPQDAVDLANKIPSNGDPVLEAAKWVFFILLLIGVASVPYMMILRKRNKDQNENQIEAAISGAGSTLYTQLVKQVEEYRKIADKAFTERNSLIERVARLEALAASLNEYQATIARMRARLDAKDRELRTQLEQAATDRNKFFEVLRIKENEIIKRDTRISQLDKAVHELTVRLARDEARQTFGQHACPLTAPGVQITDAGLLIPVPEAVVVDSQTDK